MTTMLEDERCVRSPADEATEGGAVDACVLVVDPDQAIRARIRDVLQHVGFQVLEADTERAARRLLNAVAVDLALIEMGLPGSAADAFAAEMAQHAVVPVLMSGTAGGIVRAQRSGFTFLRKPFTIKSLMRAVVLGLPLRPS
jgi:DNA-binding response OmpR family regulator